MTTLTHRTTAQPGVPQSRAIATIIAKFRAFLAARRAAALKAQTDRIVSELDDHILRDIGLIPKNGAQRGRVSLDSRSNTCGF